MMREAASAITVSVPAWPTVAPGWKGRVNAWIIRYPEIGFRVGERAMTIAWSAPRPARFPLSIRLQCAGYPMTLGLSGLEAIDARLVGEPFTGMPRSLRTLVVERLLAECIACLPPALAQGLNVVGIDWQDEDTATHATAPLDDPAEAPALNFECRNETSGAVSSGRFVFGNAAVLDWVLERFGALPVRKLDGRALGARVRLALGSSKIASAELGHLEVGGFVWIDSAAIDPFGIRGRMHLSSREGTANVHVFLKQRRVTVTDSLRVLATTATAADGAEDGFPTMDNPENAMKIDVSKLELQLDFELGDVMLPVGEIEKLGPGYVFELPQDVADSEVLLRVSGQVVAAGEIVAVGRRLGVRITRMGSVARNEAWRFSTDTAQHIGQGRGEGGDTSGALDH